MDHVLDRDAYLIGRALRRVGLLEDAKTYHAAGDNDGLSEIVARALYETIRDQDQLVSAEDHGTKAILYARLPDKLKDLIEADKANGWKLADWVHERALAEEMAPARKFPSRNGTADRSPSPPAYPDLELASIGIGYARPEHPATSVSRRANQ